MRFAALIIRVVKAAASTTATEVCKPGGETDYKPFFDIERLKQNFLHQLERFAERLENFDLRSVAHIYLAATAGDCRASAPLAKPNKDQPSV
ncbi:MAG TPA: hypothetical protein VKB96_04650, partial [Gammaproteobacteria bacterium]|nr:hypothetical protein [Gammaproteobacteria bacterium]